MTWYCPHCGSVWGERGRAAHLRLCEWQMKHRITSITGRIWTRKMVYNAASRLLGPGHGPAIRAVLDSPEFTRECKGYIPQSAVNYVYVEVTLAKYREST